MNDTLPLNDYFIATIDGKMCTTLAKFLQVVGEAFHFPDYYGGNLDAFNECINDLSWLDKENYMLIIKDISSFLADESPSVKQTMLRKLDKTSEEWKNVPNFPGEDEFRHKADFKVLLED